MCSERAASSSGPLPTSSTDYLFRRGPESTECQTLAPEKQQFSLDFFQPHNNSSYSSLTFMLKLHLRTESLVYKQFNQLEVLWAWIKIQMKIWTKLIVGCPTKLRHFQKILTKLLLVPLVSLSTWIERIAEAVITLSAKEWLFYFSIIVNYALLSATSRIQNCKPSFSNKNVLLLGVEDYFAFLIRLHYLRQSLII